MGTLLKCTDPGHGSSAPVAMAYPEHGALVIKRRSHGTEHVGVLTLDTLVTLLDPDGTSYTAVTR